MKRNFILSHFHFVSLFLTILLLFGGCGRRHVFSEKVAAKTHSITISWKVSKNPVLGYNVYRATTPGGAFAKVNNQILPDHQYTDDTVEAGKTYAYYVTSVTSRGIESKPSNNTTATVPVN